MLIERAQVIPKSASWCPLTFVIILLQRTGTVLHKGVKLVYSELSDKCQDDLLQELPLKVKGQYDNDPNKKRTERGGEPAIKSDDAHS